MDLVPSVFRERVAAFWKCCDDLYSGGCHIHQRIPDCEWTRISRKRRIEFYVGSVDGKWIYGFGDPEEPTGANRFLAMDELKSYPDLKNVVIRKINVFEKWMNPVMVSQMRPLDVDMEVLMKFVLFLSNEPYLSAEHTFNESLESSGGSTLLNWLQEMHFSHVYFYHYNANYNQLLERQHSRTKVTRIRMNSKIESGEEFLEAEFSAIRLQKCFISDYLSPNVLDAIVARFLEDPGQFGKNYEVSCYFEREKTKEILREMREKGRFVREYVNQKTGNGKLEVEGPNGKFLIISMEFGLRWRLSAYR